MKEKEQRLLQLTRFWYDYVGCDHHKDRDCHFYINKVWSYGHQPRYRVEHYGYMADYDDDTYHETYEQALDALLEWLEEQVKDAHVIPADWDDDQKYDYNWKGVLRVCVKHNLYPIKNYSDQNQKT